MVTNNKDFRVKHGLIVEANTHINGNLQVDGTINGLNVNYQAVHTQAAFDKANSSYDQTNTAITLGSTELYHGSVNTSVVGLSSLSSSNLISNVSTFNTTFNGTAGVGQLTWNDGDGTLDLGLKGGNTTVQLGQESVVRVYNDSGSTLNEGEVVYISGSQGNRIAVKRAQANSESTSVNVLGMVTENISNGAEGFVTTFGLVNHLNTIGLTGGPIFLSPTVAGAYTQTKPVAPNHLVIVGFVNRIHATVGSLFIRVDNGYELNELHNVYTDNELNDDLLSYNTANTRWENKSSASIIEPAFAHANAAYNKANTGGTSNVQLLIVTDTFTSNGLVDNYTLSVIPPSENFTSVNFNGISQQRTQYSLVDNVITFSSIPPANTLIEITSITDSNGVSISTANLAVLVNSAFSHANSSYDAANSAGVYANTGITLAQAAFDQANTGGGGSASGNIVVDSVTSNTFVSIPYALMTTSLSFANTTNANTLVDHFDCTIFRGAKYNIQVTSDSGYQVSELNLLQHDSDVMISEYGLVCSNTSVSSLGTFYANVSSGIVNLNFNPIDANNILVIYKVGLANTGSFGSNILTLPQDLMTGSGSFDLTLITLGSGTIDLN